VTADTTTAISVVLAASRYVLLDFDGPVCAIFAGRAAPLVARELTVALKSYGVSVPDEALSRGDPLDVLRFASRASETLVADIERALQAAELAAVDTALPTPGAADFLDACRQTGRTVAIVSNNSAPAITRYLDRGGIAALVAHIEGRIPASPDLMKPHPLLLQRAIHALDASTEVAMLVGDSTTDFEAAQAIGVRGIGYANKRGKAEALARAGAAAVVHNMTELSRVVADIPAP